MDRDKRWDRVKEAYDLLVEGKGKQADNMVKAMEESYAEGVTDEFVKAQSIMKPMMKTIVLRSLNTCIALRPKLLRNHSVMGSR